MPILGFGSQMMEKSALSMPSAVEQHEFVARGRLIGATDNLTQRLNTRHGEGEICSVRDMRITKEQELHRQS
jgi:hypothetical protein